MAGAAAPARTPRTAGRGVAHPAACRPFVSSTLKSENGHLLVYIGRFAIRATYRLVGSENKSFEIFTAIAALVLVDRHLTLHGSDEIIMKPV
jgi:hypothetical protein